MRRYALLLLVPFVLAGCDNNSQPTAPEEEAATAQPAATPPVQTPAAEPAVAAVPADTEPLFGYWAATPAACSSPIVISATAFEGAENSCEITALTANGDGTFNASVTCMGEGQSVSERIGMEPIFGPTGEGVRLTYLDRGGDPVAVFRCPAPRAE